MSQIKVNIKLLDNMINSGKEYIVIDWKLILNDNIIKYIFKNKNSKKKF
jgi:hypothetical protein